MNWLKNNLLILACGVIFIALLGLTGWKIHGTYRELQQVESDLQSKQDRVQQLRNSKVYPSKENIEALLKDRLQLLRFYDEIGQKLSHTGITPPPVTRDAAFNLFLVETQTALRKAAGNSNTNLESFAFGFTHYRDTYPCRDANVRGSECEKLLASLAKEIIVVDKIARLLFDSGTTDILEIKRAQILPEPPAPDTLPSDLTTIKTNGLYSVIPFQFKFACNKTEVLQTFLNKLVAADLFFVVRNVAVQSEAEAEPTTPMGFRPAAVPEALLKSETKYHLVITVQIDWVEFSSVTNANTKASAVTAN
jgi:hypothetical protein